jgi:phosphoglycerate dehydrogenase-like enzyme
MAPDESLEVLTTIPFPEPIMSRIGSLSPNIRLTLQPAKKVEEISTEVWNRTNVLYTDVLVPEPELVPNLKWVQFHYAGIDFVQESGLARMKDLRITSMSGASAIQEGEYILMMLLGLAHKLPELISNLSKQDWPADRWERFSPTELSGSTVGLVGYGSIAREVARLLQVFNVRILAAKKDVKQPVDQGYSLPGRGDVNGDYFHRLYPIEALKSMLKLCDFVVITLPLTPETKGLISREEFKAMKPGASLIHISRGGVVDEAALVEALTEKRLAGAAVDVFMHEPLPATSPLWKTPNLIITPHVSGFSPKYKDRAGEMFLKNLELFLRGEPLLNQFDPARHY